MNGTNTASRHLRAHGIYKPREAQLEELGSPMKKLKIGEVCANQQSIEEQLFVCPFFSSFSHSLTHQCRFCWWLSLAFEHCGEEIIQRSLFASEPIIQDALSHRSEGSDSPSIKIGHRNGFFSFLFFSFPFFSFSFPFLFLFFSSHFSRSNARPNWPNFLSSVPIFGNQEPGTILWVSPFNSLTPVGSFTISQWAFTASRTSHQWSCWCNHHLQHSSTFLGCVFVCCLPFFLPFPKPFLCQKRNHYGSLSW